ncbi:polysaccharide deacetylase family protein [Desulfuribacillus stibiiarsenatis]|nr:polysaccharide deacetylase family protein [Desulfuribacillus stibiiarsenatis]
MPVSKHVLLTFDDGPSRQLIPILNILKEKRVRAMFFWNTKLLYKERPWQRVIREGHIIATHCHSHKKLDNLTKEQQYKQIKTSITILEDITRIKVKYFRPPYGRFNEDTMVILRDLNVLPVMWDISSCDWINKEAPENIICNVISHISDGSIILLHELKQTVTILPRLIDEIRKQGFHFTLL